MFLFFFINATRYLFVFGWTALLSAHTAYGHQSKTDAGVVEKMKDVDALQDRL